MSSLVVETRYGKVRGERHGEVLRWKGIPYAAPPVGPLRFRPPVPPVPWTDERDATHFGPVAAQSRDPRIAILSGISDKVASGEDCLVLNVFAPAAALAPDGDGPPLPVMVWIHGGAFIMGSSSTPLYHGDTFAEQGIVVVTINYRLGIPGFLYLGDLAPDRPEGNYALLDQIAALRWVQDNIAAFGGDPAAVTLMGESAGAISIGTLLAMPAAHGLFHRAILESGAAALSQPTRSDATAVARSVLRELDTDVEGLADVPIDRLLAVQDRIAGVRGLGSFQPYIDGPGDGAGLPRRACEIIRDGGGAPVPLLIGTNHDEWNLFEVLLGEITVEAFEASVRRGLGEAIDPLLEIYRERHADHSLKRAWVDLVSDLVFRIPAIRLAEAQARRGVPVHMYRFDWKSPAFGGRLGAAHALELPFVWNRLDLPVTPILLGDKLLPLQPLANAMHHTWAQFIRNGEPNGAGLPDWPLYTAERRATLMIDRDSHVAEDPAGNARVLWPESWPTV